MKRGQYKCKVCKKKFQSADPPVSCCVRHSPGECCHYGDREVIKPLGPVIR